MAGGFATLERIITINVTYTPHGMISINTGRGDGLRDNTVSREGGEDSRPIIPGSGQKGVMRSLIEAMLAQSLGEGRVCAPAACCRKDNNRRSVPPDGRKAPCEEDGADPACPACQMFGNTKGRGRVTFHDAKPRQEVATTSRTHVAIARDTGAVASQALMTQEAIPGTAIPFEGEITLVNPEPWMVGAVLETLPLLSSLGIGAKKASGYGDLSVRIESLAFTLRPETDTETEAAYAQRCRGAWREYAKVTIQPARPERSGGSDVPGRAIPL